MYRAGNLRGAAGLLAQVLKFQPGHADALQLQGTIQFQSGFAREGQKLVERAVQLDPTNAEAWNNLGLIHHFSGRNSQARECFQRATELNPDFGDAWRNEAFILQLEGQHVQALQALSHAADNSEIHFFRGNSYAALAQHETAIQEYSRSIDLDSTNFDAWLNRGNSMMAINQPALALANFQEALKLAGQHPELHAGLAAALAQSSRFDEAISVSELALRWDPSLERAKQVKRLAEEQLRDQERAAALLESTDDAEMVEEQAHLARSLQGQGKWREALAAVRNSSNGALRFISALTLPVLCRDEREVDEALDHMRSGLETLLSDPPVVADPCREIGLTTFHLPYLGVRDRPLQELTANALLAACPSLNFSADFSPGSGRKRLGVVSALLHEHTISKVFGGLIEGTDREAFELVYFQIGKDDAASQRLASRADSHIRLPNDLAQAREMIARSNIDLLFYPELGMHPLTFYLSYSRLAPVQFTTWGHPYTTGSPSIDTFMSNQYLDREDGQAEYTEELIRLPHLNMAFDRPASPYPWARSDYGLPENRRLYGVSQMPYKFHPAFDRVLNEIVTRDPSALLVLVEPGRTYFKQLLLERWAARYPAIAERVVWLHLMPHDRFLRLLQLTDVQLAPLQFGAGRSTLDALSFGAPMVTWEGPFLKSRISSAIYRQIGFTDLIAANEESYVEVTLRVAGDREFGSHVRSEISRAAAPLYDSAIPIREWNSTLRTMGEKI